MPLGGTDQHPGRRHEEPRRCARPAVAAGPGRRGKRARRPGRRRAGRPGGTCSEATLRGTYLFATNGFIVGGKGKGPFAAGGYEVHDGHGHTRQIVSYSIDGKITRFERGTGKVTVNADCTGTAVYTDGTHYDLFIAPDGGTIVLFETDPGTVSAEVEPRVTARRVGD